MKKFITLLAVVIALPVMSQNYGKITPTLGLTGVAAATSSNLTVNIDCTKQQNVAVSTSFKLDGAGTDSTNVVLTFTKSLDGSTFPTRTADEFTWTVALNGATTVYATTNFNVGAIGYLRLKKIECLESGANLTNVTFSYAVKTKAP